MKLRLAAVKIIDFCLPDEDDGTLQAAVLANTLELDGMQEITIYSNV